MGFELGAPAALNLEDHTFHLTFCFPHCDVSSMMIGFYFIFLFYFLLIFVSPESGNMPGKIINGP